MEGLSARGGRVKGSVRGAALCASLVCFCLFFSCSSAYIIFLFCPRLQLVTSVSTTGVGRDNKSKSS